ncbi:MAG: CdaR family protein [Mariprofundaceae bacterium]
MKIFADKSWLAAIVVAFALWALVHGQGVGSVSMDVPLQVRALPSNLVIVNDLPDHVRVTVSGPQVRLAVLAEQDVQVPINLSDLTEPGVVERALKVSDIKLPFGIQVEKLQPDRLELQVDRIVQRSLPVQPRFELAAGWKALAVQVEPDHALLEGPEVWLDALGNVSTVVVQPKLQAGSFELSVGVETPAGKAIKLADTDAKFTVRGILKIEIREGG